MSNILGLVIVDGVGYRNFILSDFLKEASKEFESVIIYSGLKKELYKVDLYQNVKIVELDIYIESKKTSIYRKLNETAHLYRHRNFFGMNDTLNFTKPKTYSKRAILNRGIRFLASRFNTEYFFEKYQQFIYRSFEKNSVFLNFVEILKKDNPSILFFSHQRPPYIAPLVYAATILNIKTCSFIFSWDNLASKGRVPAMFDSFLVWSNLMKKELHYFYPSVKNENVKVVGTPQFEPYVMDIYKSSKDDFIQRFKLDSNKKTICFSCGDLSTGKNDELSIKIIAEAILTKKIKSDVNFLVRTSPADEGTCFDELKKEYPLISWNQPKWEQTRENHPEPWSQRVPLKEDVKDLRSLLEYADIGVNMCSTMSLDFMIFDKPVVNQSLGNNENGLFDDQRFLNYDHYKRVVKSGSVVIAKTEEALINAINSELYNPMKRTKQRKELIDLQISKELKGTSKRIVQTLAQLNA